VLKSRSNLRIFTMLSLPLSGMLGSGTFVAGQVEDIAHLDNNTEDTLPVDQRSRTSINAVKWMKLLAIGVENRRIEISSLRLAALRQCIGNNPLRLVLYHLEAGITGEAMHLVVLGYQRSLVK